MRPKRPLRSVYLGNLRYLSVYGLGIAQAMGQLGHWHRSVSLHDSIDDVTKQIEEMRPDVIWTHMAMWPPPGALSVEQITSILTYWKHRGVAVYLHDGDPRERDIGNVSHIFSIALVNRAIETPHYYGVPALRWPYAAMSQKQIAEPRSEWSYDLIFAGHMRDDPLYGERTKLVNDLQHRLGPRMLIVSPGAGAVNNRMLAADVAASAGSILGFARPEVKGWIDTRVFQVAGHGGVLIHDDAGEFLEPDVHYLKFDRGNSIESVIECVERAKKVGQQIRAAAFEHIQKKHTWVHRVEDALRAFYGVN